MAKKTVESVDVASKRILIRVDFNVPLDDGVITDDQRIRAALATIKSVIGRGGRAVLMSHLGRPAGKGYESSLSLKPVAARLSELLDTPVSFPSQDCTDAAAEQAVNAMNDGDVVLLENLRFHADEQTGAADFAAKLAALGDVYVNDAFGTCHRNHASMVSVPQAMADRPRVAGLLVDKEIRYFADTLEAPASPFIIVLGGAKVSDKIGAIDHLLPKADSVLVGGAMAYSFLSVIKRKIGNSRVDDESIKQAHHIVENAANLKADLHLPEDHVCSTAFTSTGSDVQVFDELIQDGFMGMDIGPKTQSRFASIIQEAKTIIWNGPMGVFEWAPFSVGTQQIAEAMAVATDRGATTIVGGGDTAAAVNKFGLADRVTHVSTGGGASLAMLAGQSFQSVDLLEDA